MHLGALQSWHNPGEIYGNNRKIQEISVILSESLDLARSLWLQFSEDLFQHRAGTQHDPSPSQMSERTCTSLGRISTHNPLSDFTYGEDVLHALPGILRRQSDCPGRQGPP